jgi:hypothetical protein
MGGTKNCWKLQTVVPIVTIGLHRANQPKDSLRTHSDTRDKHRKPQIRNQYTVRNVGSVCAELKSKVDSTNADS